MKINAQELLLINKNMKFGETNPVSPTVETTVEQSVTKPEATLNALDLQGKNNIAFQGASTSLLQKMRNLPKAAALAMGLAVAAVPAMTSCEKYEVTQSVNVDMTAFFNMMQEMVNLLQQMLKKFDISIELQNKILNALNGITSKLEDMYRQQILSQEQVEEFKNIYIQKQDEQIAILKENGATEKEIAESNNELNEKATKILERLERDEITWQQAIELLKSIDTTVKDIYKVVVKISEQIAQNHAEYMAAKDQEMGLLFNIYKNGRIQTGYLANLNKNTTEMNEKLGNIEINTKELLGILTDENKYKQFMEDLKAMMPGDIDYAKFEAMFAAYGLKMEDVINMSNEKLVALLQNWMVNDLGNETKQNELLNSINTKLDILENIPNIAGLEDAINDMKEAYQAGNHDVIASIKDVVAQLEKAIQKLDVLIKNTSNLSAYFADQKGNWAKLFDHLGEMTGDLKDLKSGQKISNAQLEEIKANFKDLNTTAKNIENYVYILTQKADALEAAMKDINAKGMTRDEFVEAMEKRDKERDTRLAEEFKNFIVEFGFDKVPGSVQKIEELLAAVRAEIKNQKDYTPEFNKLLGLEAEILAFLKGYDPTNPNDVAKYETLSQIFEEYKCECEHIADNTPGNESIPDGDDLADKFN